MSDPAELRRRLAACLSAQREPFLRAWARELRSATSAGEAEALRFCDAELDAVLEILAGEGVPPTGKDDAPARLVLKAGKGLWLRVASFRVLLRTCSPFLADFDEPVRAEVLQSLHDLGVQRLETVLRLDEDEWARRLMEAQDQSAHADERARDLAVANEELKRSHEHSLHRAEQLALLSSVTRRVAGIMAPERLLQEAASAIQARLNHTFVAVVVLDSEGVLMGRWAGRPGVSRESAGPTTGPIRGVIGRALRKRAPQVVPDVTRDADYHVDVAGTRSEMAVPLIEEGRAVGVLDIQSERPAAFDLDDVVAAEILAEFLVVALRNARLFASLHATK